MEASLCLIKNHLVQLYLRKCAAQEEGKKKHILSYYYHQKEMLSQMSVSSSGVTPQL